MIIIRIEREDLTTYANLLKQYGSKEKLSQGFQTLMEATQMDFDGDTGNVIDRSTVPHLYDVVKQNEHPDRKLGNFHKRDAGRLGAAQFIARGKAEHARDLSASNIHTFD
jgi:hypothetical protein